MDSLLIGNGLLQNWISTSESTDQNRRWMFLSILLIIIGLLEYISLVFDSAWPLCTTTQVPRRVALLTH